MESLQDLALSAIAFTALVWLSTHPWKCQRQRADRTQERHDWDWRT